VTAKLAEIVAGTKALAVAGDDDDADVLARRDCIELAFECL